MALLGIIYLLIEAAMLYLFWNNVIAVIFSVKGMNFFQAIITIVFVFMFSVIIKIDVQYNK